MNSTSEREPSSGENSTSSVYSLGVGDRGARLALDVLARRLELALDVDVARGDEGVDARALGVLDRVPGGVDVLHARARQAADDRALDLAGDRLDRLEVAGRGDREAGLDDVDAEARELVRDLDLLLRVQRDARATARRRAASCRRSVLGLLSLSCSAMPFLSVSPPALLLCWFAATRPPRAIPPEGGGGEGAGRAGTASLRTGYRVRTTLPTFLRSCMKRWASGPRSSGKASATTGRSLPSLDPLAQRLDVVVERALRVPELEHVQPDHRLRLATSA